jgi:hypothetical protein
MLGLSLKTRVSFANWRVLPPVAASTAASRSRAGYLTVGFAEDLREYCDKRLVEGRGVLGLLPCSPSPHSDPHALLFLFLASPASTTTIACASSIAFCVFFLSLGAHLCQRANCSQTHPSAGSVESEWSTPRAFPLAAVWRSRMRSRSSTDTWSDLRAPGGSMTAPSIVSSVS